MLHFVETSKDGNIKILGTSIIIHCGKPLCRQHYWYCLCNHHFRPLSKSSILSL